MELVLKVMVSLILSHTGTLFVTYYLIISLQTNSHPYTEGAYGHHPRWHCFAGCPRNNGLKHHRSTLKALPKLRRDQTHI